MKQNPDKPLCQCGVTMLQISCGVKVIQWCCPNCRKTLEVEREEGVKIKKK